MPEAKKTLQRRKSRLHQGRKRWPADMPMAGGMGPTSQKENGVTDARTRRKDLWKDKGVDVLSTDSRSIQGVVEKTPQAGFRHLLLDAGGTRCQRRGAACI